MGALPQISCFKVFFQKCPIGGTICEYVEKYKEIGWQVAHDFFLMKWALQKKIRWAHKARRP